MSQQIAFVAELVQSFAKLLISEVRVAKQNVTANVLLTKDAKPKDQESNQEVWSLLETVN